MFCSLSKAETTQERGTSRERTVRLRLAKKKETKREKRRGEVNVGMGATEIRLVARWADETWRCSEAEGGYLPTISALDQFGDCAGVVVDDDGKRRS